MKSFKDTEIGREFLAGKCYLRVRKEEYTKFVKMCDDDKLSWYAARGLYVHNLELGHDAFRLSGSGITSAPTQSRAVPELPVHPFSTLYPAPAPKQPESAPHPVKVGDRIRILRDRARSADVYKGDEFTVKTVYGIKGKIDVNFDPDWEFLAEDYEIIPPAPSLKIIITTDGTTTTARLMDGKATLRTATATCSPSDTFDFDKGARLAFDRLIDDGKCRDLHVRVDVDTSAAKAAIQSVIDALNDLPNRVKVVRK